MGAVALLCIRRLSGGDFRCVVAWGPAGGGARKRGWLTRRLPGVARWRKRHCPHPNPRGGRATLPGGPGCHGAADGRGGLPGGVGGALGAGPGDDQRLRAHRNHSVCFPDRTAERRVGGAADWVAGVWGGVVCVGWLVASGAGGCGGCVVCGRVCGGGGVLAAAGVEGVAVCGGPVWWGGGAHVSDRGFGALACGWAVGLCGPG